MPITPYDSIFISSSVLLSLQLPAYHFTQTHMGDHTFHLHKQQKKKKKKSSHSIHSHGLSLFLELWRELCKVSVAVWSSWQREALHLWFCVSRESQLFLKSQKNDCQKLYLKRSSLYIVMCFTYSNSPFFPSCSCNCSDYLHSYILGCKAGKLREKKNTLTHTLPSFENLLLWW